MDEYYASPSNAYLRRRREKREIKYISCVAGFCAICYVVVQNVISLILSASPLGGIYKNDPVAQSVVNVFMSVLGLLVPFAVGGAIISRKTGAPFRGFRRPASVSLAVTATTLGIFICLIGNYATGLFVNLARSAGIVLAAPEFKPPSDVGGRITYAISVAAVPALAEEFAIRGAILQPLRKYGDRFAVAASALLFAALHGNLVQAPFALIAGLGIGYAVCITNSVWTGVCIHFFNNLYSALTEFIAADAPDEATLGKTYTIITAALYVVSIIGSAFFAIVKRRRKLVPPFTLLSGGEKLSAFILTPPMLAALIIMTRITLAFVSFQGNLIA